MMTIMPLFGFMEILVFGLGGSLMGLPPAERDAALIQSAPADAIVYFEWAARGKGEAGAPGIDGLAGDPEVQTFFERVAEGVQASSERLSADGPPTASQAGKHLPPLIFTLLSRPACVFVRFAPEKVQLKEGLGEPTPEIILQGVQAGLVVQAGDAADDVAERLTALVNVLPDAEGAPLERQALPTPFPGGSLLLHRHDSYFIVSLGDGTLETILSGLKGESQGMLENERFQASLKKLPAERIATLSWVDIQGGVQKASGLMGPTGMVMQAMSKMIGFDALSSVTSVTSVEEGRIVKQSFVDTGGRTDRLMVLVAGRGMKAEDLQGVPADADFVSAFSLSLPGIYEELEKILMETGQKPVLDSAVERLETELQMSLKDDILASLGDVWVIYDAPSTGGTFFTSPVLSLELQDGEKAGQTVQKLMKRFGGLLREQSQGSSRSNSRLRRGVLLEEFDFLDEHIYFVNTIGDDDVPFAPALCCTDTHLLLGPHPQALKAHLRFLAGDADRYALPEPPAGELICYSSFDTKTLVRMLYGFVPYVSQMALSNLQREGIELDVSVIPSAQAILPYVDRSDSFIVRTDTGLHSRSVSSLPGGFGALTLLQLPAVTLLGVRSPVAPAIEALPMAAPLPPNVQGVGQQIRVLGAPGAVIKIERAAVVPKQAP